MFTLLDVCVSSLRRGHANLPCIVPILTDDPRRKPQTYAKTSKPENTKPQPENPNKISARKPRRKLQSPDRRPTTRARGGAGEERRHSDGAKRYTLSRRHHVYNHTCHILPFQPILWNRCFPSKSVKSAQNSPKSISEGGRIWRVWIS